MTLAVEVYDGTNPGAGSPLRTFTEDVGRSLRVARSAEGSWAVSIPHDSDDAGFVLTNRWVKFRLDGQVVQSGRIRAYDQDTIAQGEEAAEDLALSGPGLLATLRDAIVFPHEQTGRLARDTRFFNFASPDYPDEASWAAAVELYQQGDPATSLPGVTVPQDWPDPDAWWIWGTNYDLSDPTPQAIGDCYFRTSIVLADEGDYAFFITADDGYELWVDGVLLAAQTEAFIWRQTYRIDQFLDAGTHTIAIKGTNMDRPASPTTNHAGVLFAMYSTTAGGELGVLQLHSDDTWACLAYPASPPGFTPGEIMVILLQEAFDRGALQVWSWSFSGSLDSNGDAWAGEVDVSFRFSDKVLDALNKLAETWVDFAADPDTIELDMVVKGALGSSLAINLDRGVDFGSLRHSNDPSQVTDLLTQDAEGVLTEVSSGIADDPPDGDNPRIEEFVQNGTAASSSSATEQAAGHFDTVGAYRVKVTAGIEAVAGASPLADFSIGDTVQMPDRFLALADTVVEAITVADVSVEQDGELEGSVTYVVEGYQDAA